MFLSLIYIWVSFPISYLRLFLCFFSVLGFMSIFFTCAYVSYMFPCFLYFISICGFVSYLFICISVFFLYLCPCLISVPASLSPSCIYISASCMKAGRYFNFPPIPCCWVWGSEPTSGHSACPLQAPDNQPEVSPSRRVVQGVGQL